MPIIRMLESEGARLDIERRGDGPRLLLIPAGDGRSADFTAVAGMLAWDYTVLSYDRRGHARSRSWRAPAPRSGWSSKAPTHGPSSRRPGSAPLRCSAPSAGAIIGLDLVGGTQVIMGAQPAEASPDARSPAEPAAIGDLWPWAR